MPPSTPAWPWAAGTVAARWLWLPQLKASSSSWASPPLSGHLRAANPALLNHSHLGYSASPPLFGSQRGAEQATCGPVGGESRMVSPQTLNPGCKSCRDNPHRAPELADEPSPEGKGDKPEVQRASGENQTPPWVAVSTPQLFRERGFYARGRAEQELPAHTHVSLKWTR